MKLHRHRYRVTVRWGFLPIATCMKCDKKTKTPWWPMWKESRSWRDYSNV